MHEHLDDNLFTRANQIAQACGAMKEMRSSSSFLSGAIAACADE